MNRLLLALICTFIISQAVTQDLDYGVKAGLNIGTPYMKPEKGASGTPGIGPLFGVFSKYYLSDKWAIHLELFYSAKGSNFKTPVSGDTLYERTWHIGPPNGGYDTTTKIPTIYEGTVEGSYGNRYLDIPLLLSYRVGKKMLLMFGPQFSYLLKGKNTGDADIIVGDPESPFTKVNDEPFDQSHELNRWDYSILIGTQYEGKKLFNLGISLTTGLGSIYNKNYKYLDKAVRNIYLQAYLGFRIRGKRY